MSERQRVRRQIQIPLGNDEWATLDAFWPISETAWAHLIHILTTMKPGLVWEALEPDDDMRRGMVSDE